jgi:hypothetical protein
MFHLLLTIFAYPARRWRNVAIAQSASMVTVSYTNANFAPVISPYTIKMKAATPISRRKPTLETRGGVRCQSLFYCQDEVGSAYAFLFFFW